MFSKRIKEYIEAIIVAFFIAMFVRAFILQPYTIPSGSMLNTMLIGDCVLVNKFVYGVKIPFTHKYIISQPGPERGDVIVFEFPGEPSQTYTKRVVGLPGDTITVLNKDLYVNGAKVSEPYVQHVRADEVLKQDNFGPFKVPEGEYFMMGDNRDDSSDSREWGTVKRDAIIGKVWRVYWSWESISNIRWNRLGELIQ